METKKQYIQEEPREIANKWGVNLHIIGLIDNGGLTNWNEIRRLPDQMTQTFGIEPKTHELLIIGNILAKAVNFPIEVNSTPLVGNPEQEKLDLIAKAALLMSSYPKGIDPKNEAITFQISEDDLHKLGTFLERMLSSGTNTLRKHLKDLGFVPNPNLGNQVWFMRTNPKGLKQIIEEKIGK